MPTSDSPVPFGVTRGELDAVAALVRRELGDDSVTGSYLDWWYFQNPSKAFSLVASRDAEGVVGMATMNGLKMRTEGDIRTVGLPQKVLVGRRLRGKGLFGTLYWESERECLERGADFFLTFTNEASTPIFLNKFGYRRGVDPSLLLVPADLRGLFRRPAFRQTRTLAPGFFAEAASPFENAFIKDHAYFVWRYLTHAPDQYVILEVSAVAGVAGYLFLKRIKKRGLPLLLLMDIAVRSKDVLPLMLRQATAYASRSAALGVLLFANADLDRVLARSLHQRIRNRFNFLVKGRDAESTAKLAETPFSFSFGDLDFV